MDSYEVEAGFILSFVDLDEAINTNLAYKSEDCFNVIMIQRDTKVLQMIKDSIVLTQENNMDFEVRRVNKDEVKLALD